MSDELCIRVPWEPTAQVSPNSRLSTRTKRAHHAIARDTAALAVVNTLQGKPYTPPEQVAVDVVWVRSKGRNRMDLDNLIASCKGVIDGVTRKLNFDDRRIITMTVAQRRDANQPGCVIVTVREATQEERQRAA